jgi:hypothetical protein
MQRGIGGLLPVMHQRAVYTVHRRPAIETQHLDIESPRRDSAVRVAITIQSSMGCSGHDSGMNHLRGYMGLPSVLVIYPDFQQPSQKRNGRMDKW